MHIFHKWSRWTEPQTFDISFAWSRNVSTASGQTRTCAKCGKKQSRLI